MYSLNISKRKRKSKNKQAIIQTLVFTSAIIIGCILHENALENKSLILKSAIESPIPIITPTLTSIPTLTPTQTNNVSRGSV